jgi:hypothetical protein
MLIEINRTGDTDHSYSGRSRPLSWFGANPTVAGFPVFAFHCRPGDAMSGLLELLRTARLIFRPGTIEGSQVDVLRACGGKCD